MSRRRSSCFLIWLAGLVLYCRPAVSDIVITEFMASNLSGLQDEDGAFPDWIELYNSSASSVNLDGYYLTNDSANLTQWRCPAKSLGAKQYLVVFASEKNKKEPAGNLHTNFKLDAAGEYLALIEPDGQTAAFQYSPKFPRQMPEVSYGVAQDAGGQPDAAQKLYFSQPTPRAVNGAGFTDIAEEPHFSQTSGAFAANFNLALSTVSAGNAIRYTTNGTEPTAGSPAYTAPIAIGATSVVRAKTFHDGLLPSPTASHYFVKVTGAATTFSSNLPVFVINTFGTGINQNTYTSGHLLIMAPDGDGRASMTEPPHFAGNAALKVRGSSTAGDPKASYTMEIRDAFGQDLDAEILGLPEESDFVLYAPYYFDRALIRNALIFEISNEVGRYAARTRYCEVYLNTGTSAVSQTNYVGVYTFMEKIKRDRNRVNIEKLTPGDNAMPDIGGGYMLKIDRLDPGDQGVSAGGFTLGLVEPKEQEITAQQKSWIQNYINTFVNVLNGPNFTDPVNGYARYIDPDSWIDHHILNVLPMNVDALRLSAYFYKSRYGRIEYGPIWDFDRSMDSYDGRDDNAQTWKGTGDATDFFGYPWWSRLFQDPDFWQKWRDRWQELRQNVLSEQNIHDLIDSMAAELDEAQARNFQKWPSVAPAVSYAQEISRLKQWLDTRLVWIDSNFLVPPIFSPPSRQIIPGFQISMNAGTGTIYYTTDGADPRLPGGGVSPSAIEYGSSNAATLLSPSTHTQVRVLVPSDGSLGTSWTGLSFNDASWRQGTTGIAVGYERQTGYESFIDVDVGTDMYNVRTTCYLRIPFEVTNPAQFTSLSLRMMYDDGFAVYLNDALVASANAPSPAAWDSGATSLHDDAAAVVFQNFNISQHVDKLVQGTNILAIQGFNSGATSSDFLIVPELKASGVFSGNPITLNDFTRIKARTSLNGDWSAPGEATYVLDRASLLRVTELMYHPPEPAPGSSFRDEDFEFIEIQNTGAKAADLRGVRFTRGIDFDFTESGVESLVPGDYVLIMSDRAAFNSRYSSAGLLIAGEFTGSLENQGETIRLENGIGEAIQEFTYEDFWYPQTDGGGYSLTIIDPDAPADAWNQQAGWKPSDLANGSPGEGESVAGGRQLPGDANQDSALDLGDAVRLMLLLFQGAGRTPPCEGATVADGSNVALLDHNGDAAIDPSDVIHLLNYLFLHGAPHVLGASCVRLEGCPTACAR